MQLVATIVPLLGVALALHIPGPDLQKARTQLIDADFDLSAQSENAGLHKLADGLAPDAMLVVSRRPPLRSHADIRSWLATDSLSARGAKWYPVRADVSADGRDGYTYGYLALRGHDDVTRPGKYLAYWRRDTKGRWKILAFKRLPREAGIPGPIPMGFEAPSSRTGAVWPGGSTAAIASLRTTDLEFAAEAQRGATAAFEKYTAPDGATLGAGPSIAYGPKQSGAEFATFAPGTITWEPAHVDAAGSGDLGFAIGPVSVRQKAEGAFETVGHYLTIWRRQVDGSWRVVIDG